MLSGRSLDVKIASAQAAVVFGDFQENNLSLSLTVTAENIRRAARGLAQLAEVFDMPTFAMTIPTADGGTPEVIDEIRSARSRYLTYQRHTPDSFENEPFREAVAATGCRTLIVAGIATEVCLNWLVLSGLAEGYDVHVVVDASAGLGLRSERAAFARFEKAGATLTSVVSLAGELAGDFTQAPGSDALAVIHDIVGLDV